MLLHSESSLLYLLLALQKLLMADDRGDNRHPHQQNHEEYEYEIVGFKLCRINIVCLAVDQVDVIHVQLKVSHIESFYSLKHVGKLLINHRHEKRFDSIEIWLLANCGHAESNA